MHDPDIAPARSPRRSPAGARRRFGARLLLLLAPALPSCITGNMWAGEWQLQSESYAATHAQALAADGATPLRLLVAVQAEAADAIGAGEHADDSASAASGSVARSAHRVWLELVPEQRDDFATVLRHLGQDARDVECEVRFWPPSAGAPRRADVRLRAVVGDELERTGMRDVRPSRQALQRLTAESVCSWRVVPAAPPTDRGRDLPPATITVLTHERVGLGTTEMVLFTPLTVACDVVLLPLELLLLVALQLAD